MFIGQQFSNDTFNEYFYDEMLDHQAEQLAARNCTDEEWHQAFMYGNHDLDHVYCGC